MTFAVFHAEGNMPVVNDMLKIWHKGNAMDGARALRTRLGMPSGPDALHVGSFFR